MKSIERIAKKIIADSLIEMDGSNRQTYDYDCGSKILQIIFGHYGVDVREEQLMKETECSKEGISVKNIIKVCKKYGFDVEAREMTIDDIKKFIDDEKPVLIVLQAWAKNGNLTDEEWKEEWNEGHYVLAVGYKENKILFKDPSVLGMSYLTEDELENRWHELDLDGEKYINFGIVLSGKEVVETIVEHMD